MSTSVLERIMRGGSLPTPPRVVQQLLEQIEDDDISIGSISDLLQKDPASAARVLKVANSALFGYPGTIGSLHQAAVVLGLRAIKVLALSFAVWDVLHPQSKDFDFPLFLRRSLTTAIMAKLIANAMGSVRRDEAFAGGLLCDIGMLAAVVCVPDEYRKVLAAQRTASAPAQDIELRILNVTHAQISAALLRKWGLPAMLCDAVELHHTAGPVHSSSRLQLLSRALWAASTVSDVFCGDIPAAELDSTTERTAEVVGLDFSLQQGCMMALDGHLRETANMWQVDIGETLSYETLRDRALSQLAKISLEGEQARVEAIKKADLFERRAMVDPLTTIANRAEFDRYLAASIEEARKTKTCLAVVMMDLDRFKQINDRHGHQAGDAVLQSVGRVLKGLVAKPWESARYGGEEFGIVMPRVTKEELAEFVEKLRAEVETMRVTHKDCEISVTASLGGALFDFGTGGMTREELVDRADKLVYRAKERGRNRAETGVATV